MTTSHAPQTSSDATPVPDYDVIIIGAGMSGMYQLLRLRELGMRVRVFEAGTGVGGTWYWNRYPGARFDSESYSYSYSFSKELLEEWNWSEHFAGQPETLRYLNHVADKFALRQDIQFCSRVAEAQYQEATRSWEITLQEGSRFRARCDEVAANGYPELALADGHHPTPGQQPPCWPGGAENDVSYDDPDPVNAYVMIGVGQACEKRERGRPAMPSASWSR